MVVFNTFFGKKTYSDERTTKIKLYLFGDEDESTYYIIRQESESKSDVSCSRNAYILNHSISDAYHDTKNTFDKEIECLKRAGYLEWEKI